MTASRRPAAALLAFTFLVAGASEARPLLTLGSALLVADTEDEPAADDGEASSQVAAPDDDAEPAADSEPAADAAPAATEPAATEPAATEPAAADAAPAATEPAADDAAPNKLLLPTVKGAVLGAVVGALVVGIATFLIVPMFSPELEQLGIGDGQAWMTAIWSVAIAVPTGALLGGAIGAGAGYAIATIEE